MNELNFKNLINYLKIIYNKLSNDEIETYGNEIKKIFKKKSKKKLSIEIWDEKDCFLITYADSVIKKKKTNFSSLDLFLNKYCKDFSFIHILPFYPFSSDDGFAVVDYKRIKKEHGDWIDLKRISKKFKIMTDLVINHCSSQNKLFKNFLVKKSPGNDFFISSKKEFDNFSKVVRPRESKLSKEVKINGEKIYVWCTFSHDQVDFDFKNPNVLIYFVKLIKFYLDQGVNALRLDAVAFLWKKKGTKCINLTQTHLIIRLIRLLIESYSRNCLIITETNIPNHENLSYFGNNNEAHCIYNFSFAPLVIHAIISENNVYLKKWSRSMPPAQFGNSYLNFLSTHDGIGMRPLEGLLPEVELKRFIKTLESSGAYLTHRVSGKKKSVYEVNTTLLDAFKQTYRGKDDLAINRFVLAHEILFCMEGIPAIYIQNLIGSKNDNRKFKITKKFRSVNRRNWDFDELTDLLIQENSANYKAYNSITKLLKLRKKQPAFHPNATQFTLQLPNDFFGIWRQSLDRSQSIFCISNLSKDEKIFSLLDINLIAIDSWHDILTKRKLKSLTENIILKPYQSIWITNKKYSRS